MKNINSIITGVLAIAVAVLFFLHFKNTNNKVVATPKNTSGKPCLIAYFEMDSLQSQYEYYKDVVKELNEKEKDARNSLAKTKNENINLLRKYQEQFKDIGAKGNVSEADQKAAMQAQQHLQEVDKNYQAEEQALASKLSDDTRAKLGDVKKKVEAFLKEYNKNNVYAFIISNSADLLYYKDSSYDITNDIIKGLNAEYKKGKK